MPARSSHKLPLTVQPASASFINLVLISATAKGGLCRAGRFSDLETPVKPLTFGNNRVASVVEVVCCSAMMRFSMSHAQTHDHFTYLDAGLH